MLLLKLGKASGSLFGVQGAFNSTHLAPLAACKCRMFHPIAAELSYFDSVECFVAPLVCHLLDSI